MINDKCTEVAQIYLGNIKFDPVVANLIETKSYLKLSLSPSDRHKGRIHAYTDSGIAVGIIKDRDRAVHSGDLYRTDSNQLLLIELEAPEVLVINLDSIKNTSPQQLVRLGHLLGNHHYPIAIDGDRILVQLVTDKPTVAKLIASLNISGLKLDYQKISADREDSFSQHSH